MNGESSTPTAYAVNCPEHGIVYLTDEEYSQQMNDADARWECPRALCGRVAEFNDTIYELATNDPRGHAFVEHRAQVMKSLDDIAVAIGNTDLTQPVVDFIEQLEEMIDDKIEPDPALWPSALLVCVNDQAGFFFDEAPTHKCPLCNAELLEVAMWDGSFSKENAQ